LAQEQSPIFSKTSDFILWLLNHTDKFPKSERFRMGQRLEEVAFGFHEDLLAAVHGGRKRALLAKADLQLDKLRFYLRLSQARHLTSKRQYQYAAEQVMEIGNLLGGWKKSLTK
jgi:hypothetical protein